MSVQIIYFYSPYLFTCLFIVTQCIYLSVTLFLFTHAFYLFISIRVSFFYVSDCAADLRD